MGAVFYGVIDVLRACSVPQVVWFVVIRITVRVVTNLLTFGAGSVESLRNKLVDVRTPLFSICLDGDPAISLLVEPT